jgi:hypothetical protein
MRGGKRHRLIRLLRQDWQNHAIKERLPIYLVLYVPVTLELTRLVRQYVYCKSP